MEKLELWVGTFEHYLGKIMPYVFCFLTGMLWGLLWTF
jgi:hypothetical protein